MSGKQLGIGNLNVASRATQALVRCTDLCPKTLSRSTYHLQDRKLYGEISIVGDQLFRRYLLSQ
jgi:hypothetical protein